MTLSVSETGSSDGVAVGSGSCVASAAGVRVDSAVAEGSGAVAVLSSVGSTDFSPLHATASAASDVVSMATINLIDSVYPVFGLFVHSHGVNGDTLNSLASLSFQYAQHNAQGLQTIPWVQHTLLYAADSLPTRISSASLSSSLPVLMLRSASRSLRCTCAR